MAHSRYRSKTVPVLAAFLLCVITMPALADPGDTLGVGWAGRGRTGAAVAGVHDYSAAYYNPGAAIGQRPAVIISLLHVISGLSPETADTSEGSFLEAGAILPLLKRKGLPQIWFSLAAMTPTSGFYEMNLPDDEDTSFALYNSREERLLLTAAIAIQVHPSLSLGVGLEMLPTVDAAVALDVTDSTGVNDLAVTVGYRLSPTAGIHWNPLDWLKAGLSWRAENHSSLDLPVDVKAGGVDLSATVNAKTFFVPHRFTAGVEAGLGKRFAVELDVTWYHYGAFPSPAADVSMYSTSGEDTLGTTLADPELGHRFSPALAVSYTRPELQLQAGYRYSPTAFPEPAGITNLLDNDTHTWALGFRLPLLESPETPRMLALTGNFFAAWMPERRVFKKQVLVGNPGYPDISFGGYRLGLALGAEVEF
jgi:hypothetical protein